jgi:O-antigen/teichoic acid export membrane protein
MAREIRNSKFQIRNPSSYYIPHPLSPFSPSKLLYLPPNICRLSGIKKLAGQTLWYGISSIAARFLNYLLTPYLTDPSVLKGAEYGEMTLVYAAFPFLNVIFTYGLETAYFRFSKNKQDEQKVYNTCMVSLVVSSIILTSLMMVFRNPLAHLIGVQDHPEYLAWGALIIGFDALTALSFAKLRFQERPKKFAFVRVAGIIINIALTVFFLSVCPRIQKHDPHSFIGTFYNPALVVGYVIIANLVQSIFTLVLLSKEFFSFKWKFDPVLWKQILLYSSPLILAGFAGMINETFDRIMLHWWTSAPTETAARIEVGTYGACYKLSILITLSVQAFRMAAEPFFFSAAHGEQPQRIYARVMKFFVITVCLMFLAVVLYLDIWKYFISNHVFWKGLKVVPILLLANMFLGIYYNLSIWYKVSNKTMAGAWITVVGAVVTVIINYFFIPRFGYMACAWATFSCYGSMMVLSYIWGQKNYRVPYALKKLLAYLGIAVILYFVNRGFHLLGLRGIVGYLVATVLLLSYTAMILKIEKKEFSRLPYIGKYIH